ncbi:MAG: lipopolysaccharide biosynthesis protein [Acidimicrobiia bacterium]
MTSGVNVKARPWRRVGLPLLVLRLLGQGLEFAGFVVLARRLDPSGFGTLSVAFLIARYGGLVGDWGASVRGVRDIAALASPVAVRSLQRRRLIVTTALAVVYAAGAVAAGHGRLAPLVVTLVSRGLNRDWIALGRERGLRAGLPLAVQGLLVLLGSVFVGTVAGAAAVIAPAYAVSLLISLLANRLPEADAGDRTPVDGWLLAAVLADQVTISTDTVLIAALRSTDEAGVYAAVYRIPNAWLTLIGLVVVGVVPATTRAMTDDPAAIGATVRRNLRVSLIAASVVLVTLVPTVWAVPVLFGDSYRSGRTAVAVLLAATAVNAVAAALHPVYLALVRDRSLAAISSGAAALNVVANLAFVPHFGMVAAASATLAAQLLLLISYSVGVTRAAARAGAVAAPGRLRA